MVEPFIELFVELFVEPFVGPFIGPFVETMQSHSTDDAEPFVRTIVGRLYGL